jgi:hypothetical protein
MRTYIVHQIKGAIDWNSVEKAEIDNILWHEYPENIRASAQLCYNEDSLNIRLSAREREPLARFEGLLDMVHLDSCLEFFFRPGGDKGPYFNFEFNPKGTTNFGVGMDRASLIRLVISDYRERFLVNPFVMEEGWGIDFSIPVSLFMMFNSTFRFKPGLITTGNFYKCGKDSKVPHHLSWNYIDSDRPDFHRPEFFGTIIFA